MPELVPNLDEPDHYRPEAPDDLVNEAREFVATATWTWAKTFARFAPHWYTLRRNARDKAGYDALRTLIQRYNYARTWRTRTFRSITLDGRLLWIMPDDPGTSNGGSVLINSKPAEPSDWAAPGLF
jgi:hypothetical protein